MSTLSFHADSELEKRIRSTAKERNVPVSRFLKETVEQALSQPRPTDAATLLAALHANGKGLPPDEATGYLRQVHADRKTWRGQ